MAATNAGFDTYIFETGPMDPQVGMRDKSKGEERGEGRGEEGRRGCGVSRGRHQKRD
jgi:hypothetical protein